MPTAAPRSGLRMFHSATGTLAGLFTVRVLVAQSAPPASPTTARSDTATAAPITLTQFEVVAESDPTYGALNSNSIARFNVELSRLPISADVLTGTLIKDTGAMSVEALILKNSAGADESSPPVTSTTGRKTSTPPRPSTRPIIPAIRSGFGPWACSAAIRWQAPWRKASAAACATPCSRTTTSSAVA